MIFIIILNLLFVIVINQNIINSNYLIDRTLSAHNIYRKQLGVFNLIWNQTLADNSFLYAIEIYNQNILNILNNNMVNLVHSSENNRPNQGENLAYYKGYNTSSPQDIFTMITNQWILNERVNFKYNKCCDNMINPFSIGVFHYTQCISKNSISVGCGLLYKNGGNILVCRYYPPGNIFGKYPY